MQIEHLYDLLEVARCGSINKASTHLHMQQQNLSRMIRKFEAEINMTIFNRTSKGLTPTHQGEQVLERISQIVTLYDEIRQLSAESAAIPAGKLLYYSTADIWATTIYQLIDEFVDRYPQVVVTVEETSIEYVPQQLRCAQHAVGKMLLIDNGRHVNYQVSADQELRNTYPMRPVVFAHKDSAFAQRYKSISLKALLRQKQEIAIYRPYTMGKTIAESIFEGLGTPNIRYSCSNAQGFYNLLRRGECVAVGCLGPFNMPDRADIAIIPIRDKVTITAGILTNRQDGDDPLVKAFTDFIAQYLNNIAQT